MGARDRTMANVFDVAAYILQKQGEMTAMKLQKLVYYSQAWSVVWDERPLFNEKIAAWVNGPVVPLLYQAHRGCYWVGMQNLPQGNTNALDAEQRETIDAVLAFYGDKTAQWLSDLTHQEHPWRLARAGLPADDNSKSPEVTLASLQEYYGSLPPF